MLLPLALCLLSSTRISEIQIIFKLNSGVSALAGETSREGLITLILCLFNTEYIGTVLMGSPD